jgi:voltage-dependent calcium channel L type alpha-1D
MTEKPDKFGNWPVDPDISHLCSYNDSSGWFKCPKNRFCGAPHDFNLTLARENFTEASYMNFGLTTFDNIGVSMLTIFQSITLEGWSDLMYMMMDSGSPAIASIFFILLIFFG